MAIQLKSAWRFMFFFFFLLGQNSGTLRNRVFPSVTLPRSLVFVPRIYLAFVIEIFAACPEGKGQVFKDVIG